MSEAPVEALTRQETLDLSPEIVCWNGIVVNPPLCITEARLR